MGRMRGLLWLTAGVLVALVAGLVAYAALTRATAQPTGQAVTGPRVKVVVAARAVTVRAKLVAEDLVEKELPVELAPEGAVPTLEDAVGKLTLVDLYPGEIILSQRLVDPNVTAADGRLALVVAEEEVLMAFPAEDLMSRVGVLKPGDHVDLLFSLQFPANRGLQAPAAGSVGGEAGGDAEEKELATFSLLQNVTVSAVVAGKTPTGGDEAAAPQAILLTISPQDALILKYAKDAGATPDIILRAPGVDVPFATEPVDVDFMIDRYRIPTGAGR